MRSLTLKVILAFVVVCLVQAMIVAFVVRDSTRQSFDRFVEEGALRILTEDIASYYEIYNTLDGIDSYISSSGRQASRPQERPSGGDQQLGNGPRRGGPPGGGPPGSDPPGSGPQHGGSQRSGPPRGGPPGGGGPPGRAGANRPGRRGPMYGFADLDGTVMLSNGGYQIGDTVTGTDLAQSQQVEITSGLSGYILQPAVEAAINPEARQYLMRTDRALLFALGGGFLVALVLGASFARTYMRPLRELTAATREITKGAALDPIQVRTKDEIGVLTRSFNQMAEELDRVNQSRKQMTADIAHELRSPLGILTGYLEAFQEGDLKPSEDRIAMMFTEAKHLERLIEDLRVMALADAGELPLNQIDIPINDLLERAQGAFAQSAKERNVSIVVEPAEASTVLSLDPVRIMQVFTNLIGNALRYTPEGGQITLRAHRNQGRVEVSVQDTGAGIPESALPHIFDRFYKVDSSRTDHLETSGLGLAISKSIVEAHGGTMSIASKEGKGTTVSMDLPLIS